MSHFAIHIDNLRGLRQLRWSPSGVCLLVGANGAGKSTVLLVLKMLRAAVDRGLAEAVQLTLGGAHALKHRDALEDEPITIAVELDGLRWAVQLTPRGASVDYLTTESLHDGDRVVFHRDALGAFAFGAHRLKAGEQLGLRTILDSQFESPEVERIAAFLRRISVYHDPDLYGLRGGSNTAQTRHLHSRGGNALTMLRQWQQRRPDRHRYELVLSGLRAAFPGLVEDLDFIEAGQTLAAQIYRPGVEAPDPLGFEANGVLAMLVNLCDLAAADDGGIVAIDEPETALHPFAVRAFARHADRLARNRDVRVMLATHSTVLLDHFDATPGQVYVLDRERWPGPTRLTDLKNAEWLRQFRLGSLYSEGQIANNDSRG